MKIRSKRKAKRNLFQAAFALATNANVPGLNCYACPGALGSCPLGALQNGFNDPVKKFSFYAAGLMALFGVAFGRLVCSRMCLFGLLQEILNAPAAFLEKKFAVIKNIRKALALQVHLPVR
ncbi:MAG: 4Fe-4S binding protein, partial [Clostridiales bacterium]|nr:4Fe-4S binding protein [Clostridiales bacterium]